ncbi:MAG: NfeD family protein [Proteobacteria bacterium]|uniref:NfeD family protein n=1 Tax=Candidatus Avisuccinivibrio stercorigallinarum TaxID=2840704 RepID=A0A9D9DBX5_9GAMM|nr:NfeD family protein [Candidatus Avisuccinivibrio stercorigallinarum]
MSFFTAGAVWCILAFIILGSEMMLGTLYLLCAAAGCFAAALMYLLDFDLPLQLFTAALVTFLGSCAVFYIRRRIKPTYREDLNSLDAGQRVQVEKVNPDGSAEVTYRGAKWTAVAPHDPLTPGTWEILKADGTRLILKKKLF